MKKHKTLGQVYTPDWVVNEILNLVNYNDVTILNKYILEPACGDGAFLIEIVSRYIDIAKKNNLSSKEIKSNLEKYIYGIEFDEFEYKKCLSRLNEITKKEIDFEHLNWQVFNQNTLKFYQRYNSFFDYIVGNPPYIRIHNLDLQTREIIKQSFNYSKGTVDIYLSFFEMGFYMLKQDGFLGYITPNSYLHNSSYKSFRAYLKESKKVNTIIDFKSHKIFKGFSTYTAITIIKNNSSKDFFIYKELINNRINKVNEILYSNLNDKDWSFTNRDNELFLSKLNENKPTAIKELFDVQYGFATLRDKVFIGTIENNENNSKLVYFNGHPMEKNILKTVVKGSKFKGNIEFNRKIIFPYKKQSEKYVVIDEDEMKNLYPNCYHYFLKNKDELIARDIDKGALWYEYGRSQGIQSIHNEKIVLSTLVNGEIFFHKISEDVLMYSGIFITKKHKQIEWNIIEDVLKSDDFLKFIRLTGKDFSSGYKSITSKQIKEYKINQHKTENYVLNLPKYQMDRNTVITDCCFCISLHNE